MVAAARRAAASDTLAALTPTAGFDRAIIALPRPESLGPAAAGAANLLWDYDLPDRPFHFGDRLAGMIRAHRLKRVVYIGAGSMPLLPASDLNVAVSRVARAAGRAAVTNNIHSADWVAFSDADSAVGVAHWLDRDNMLAWRLRESAGYRVESFPPSAATRLDIDTPFDLQALALHPNTAPYLRLALQGMSPELNLAKIRDACRVLRTPGARITLIGRVSAAICRRLESKRLWTRVFSEERGMAANHRQAEGRVFSIVADHISHVGEEQFVSQLTQVSDLILWDTRVHLAHHRRWPPAEDRFASDLGRPELVGDERLKRLTAAAASAPIPVILGGHNVVSGGLYALLEIAET